MRRLKALGFANVHVEPFDMPVWVRGEEQAEIVSPFPQQLVLTALGNSGCDRPERASTAEIVAFHERSPRCRPRRTAPSGARSSSSTIA